MIECDRQGGMGEKGEDMEQRSAGRTRTRVSANRNEWYALYP